MKRNYNYYKYITVRPLTYIVHEVFLDKCRVDWVVQLNFTQEIEIFCMLFDRALYLYFEIFQKANRVRCKI